VARTRNTTSAAYEMDSADAKRAERLLAPLRLTRYLFYVAVHSTLLAAILAMIYGALDIIAFVVEIIREGNISRTWGAELRLTVIEVVDLFLTGTVLFVIAVGAIPALRQQLGALAPVAAGPGRQ
jgi:uncharacterized membrane protein YqhA